MWIVLAKAQMDENNPTTSRGKKTNLGVCIDASSESGVYKLAYGDFDDSAIVNFIQGVQWMPSEVQFTFACFAVVRKTAHSSQ